LQRFTRCLSTGGRKATFLSAAAAVLVTWLITGVVAASADGEQPLEFTHSAGEIRKAEEAAPLLTDPVSAEELPHRDLGRAESEELLEGVFGPLIESPAGIFGDLHAEKFVSNEAAVVSGSQLSDITGEAPSAEERGKAFLLESTTPLRTESPSGDLEPVDLGLEGVFGTLHPANPLIEVAIPSQLGEGIELPEAGVQIELEGAPAERSPSTLGETVAFYPNVAKDTDFAVAPTPAGVETLTQVRSAEAPRRQTLNLQLPAGAVLEETPEGGAVAVAQGEPLLTVLPPTAIDAAGNSVPTDLAVEGDSLRITISPDAGAAYPIAVDPNMWDNYNWVYDGHPGWTGANTGGYTNAFRAPDTGCSTYCYLRTSAMSGTYETGTQSYWQYQVPRFESDWWELGKRPTSWIQAYNLGNITFASAGDWQTTPSSLFAVSDQNGAWRQAVLLPPNQAGGFGINLNSDHTGKIASFGLFSTARNWISAERYLLTGTAAVALGDETPPVFEEIEAIPWVNNTAKPFNFMVSDSGLGIYQVSVRTASGTLLGAAYVTGCDGTVRKTCPRRLRGAQDGHTIPFDPSGLPQGSNILKLESTDPVGNSVTGTVEVLVDHTAPQLSLSGTMTEQATLGKSLPQYTLRTEAKDGTTGSPQSGIVSTEVKVDGNPVTSAPSWSPGCATQNCTLTKEWTLNSSEYAVGKHTVKVTTTDGVGLKATKSVIVELAPDESKPALAGSGSLIGGPEGWVEQKSYSIIGEAEDPKGYGVTKMQLLIDGNVIATTSQSCAAGACAMNKTYTVNTGSQTGGEHVVSLIATDGAGNATESKWEIYVDPKGQVSAGEVTQTLESYEETTEAQPVAATDEVLEAAIVEAGDDPSFEKADGEYVVTGVPIDATVGATPAAGFTLEGEDGEIEVVPVGSPPGTEVELAGDESAAVVPSTATGVDTIVRAEYNGLMAFQAIREPTSPESFSWTINMSPNQTLKAIDSQHAAVYWASGDEAFLITAEAAHDATGKEVPTRLEVAGSTLTLVVEHHKEAFVYPVTAGTAYETSYVPPTITEMPVYEGPPEPEEGGNGVGGGETGPDEGTFSPPATRAEVERFLTARDIGIEVPAPTPAPGGGATTSGVAHVIDPNRVESCQVDHCANWHVTLYPPTFIYGTKQFAKYAEWIPGATAECRWHRAVPIVIVIVEKGCGTFGRDQVWSGNGGEHLSAFGRWEIKDFTVGPFETVLGGILYKALQFWAYPNGYQKPLFLEWKPQYIPLPLP
jgi:hypothetical protein